ncbi:MAG TPA: hypothetical protein PLJ36_05450 [Ruminococcus bromii]|nr:hypothetical protein [Ruminococcus bromii]
MKLLNKLTLKNLRLNKAYRRYNHWHYALGGTHHGSFGNGTQRTTDYD